MGKVIALILAFALSFAVSYVYSDQIKAFSDNIVDTVSDAIVEAVTKINPPKDADAIYSRVKSTMEGLDKYRVDAHAYMKQYSEDTEIVTEIINQTIETRPDAEDYYFLTAQETKVSAESVGYENYAKVVYAYEDGNAYIAVGTDGVVQRLCSPMTKNDFIEFMRSDSPDFDVESAGKKTFTYSKEERTWILNYSEYEYADIIMLGESFFGAEVFEEYKLLDVNFEIVVDQLYLITDMNVDFIFEGTEEEVAPGVDAASFDGGKAKAEPLYSAGEVKVKRPELSIYYEYYYAGRGLDRVELEYNEYTKVDDVSVLKDYSNFMTDTINAESNSARVTICTKYAYGSDEQEYNDTYIVNYGEGDNGYFFHMELGGDVGDYDLDYEGGYLCKTQNGQTEYEVIEERDAKKIVESYVTVNWYQSYRVTDIIVLGPDMYHLVLEIDPETLLSGDTASLVTEMITYIYAYHADGEILLLTSEIYIKLASGESITETCTIDYEYNYTNK